VYEGFLTSRDLVREMAERHGREHVWSPSRLNSYGNCPFGYFAQNLLKLEAQPDPVEGMDALQFGSLLHKILEDFYRRLTDESLSLSTTTCERALQLLGEVCEQTLSSAPGKYGFRPGALWRYEREDIQRMLDSLVRWECKENGAAARFAPCLQEVRFGLKDAALPTLHSEQGRVDFRLHGVIDRDDRDADGNLRVIDYKSGRTPFSRTDIKKGLSLQTALYALAAEVLLSPGARVAESHYLHIPIRERSGGLEFSGAVIEEETVREAVRKAYSAVEHIRRGEFPAAPAKPAGGSTACRERCDYASLCRVTRQSMLKARRRGF
jgi:ATP-dependent helicase/DNAse subunit B